MIHLANCLFFIHLIFFVALYFIYLFFLLLGWERKEEKDPQANVQQEIGRLYQSCCKGRGKEEEENPSQTERGMIVM